MERTAMCFCLLPVNGLNLNFVLPRELVDLRIFDNLMRFYQF